MQQFQFQFQFQSRSIPTNSNSCQLLPIPILVNSYQFQFLSTPTNSKYRIGIGICASLYETYARRESETPTPLVLQRYSNSFLEYRESRFSPLEHMRSMSFKYILVLTFMNITRNNLCTPYKSKIRNNERLTDTYKYWRTSGNPLDSPLTLTLTLNHHRNVFMELQLNLKTIRFSFVMLL